MLNHVGNLVIDLGPPNCEKRLLPVTRKLAWFIGRLISAKSGSDHLH
jgi:hypothetical protein